MILSIVKLKKKSVLESTILPISCFKLADVDLERTFYQIITEISFQDPSTFYKCSANIAYIHQ